MTPSPSRRPAPDSTARSTLPSTDRRLPAPDPAPEPSPAAPSEVPRFLVKINESLFSRATAKQIFMIDMDLQKSKRDKVRDRPKEKETGSKVKSDREIKVPGKGRKGGPEGKKAGHEVKKSEGNETLSYLNANATEIVASVRQQYQMGGRDEVVETKQAGSDSFNLSNYSPKSE